MNSSQSYKLLMRLFGSAAVLVCVMALAGCGNRQLPRDTQVVDGMAIYIGVVPAELVKGHPIEPGDSKAMHGGVTRNAGSHHLIVALFDAKSGARISDARIRVSVSDRSNDHQPDTWLEPMRINDTITYGNFFSLSGQREWRIHLEIQRTGIAHTAQADFQYQHASER